MTEEQRGLSGIRSSAGQFLLFQTGKPKIDALPSDADDEKPRKVLENLTASQELAQKAMEHLKNAAMFSAMAIRLDDYDPKSSENAEFFHIVADAVQTVCIAQNGLHGEIGSGWFGCFIPEKTAIACKKIAEAIRSAVPEAQKRSITIGISQFPTLDYSGAQILENALKAVHHAEFFGPDSTACFDAVSLNISGDKYYQNGDIQNAVDEFKRALSLDSANVNVHNSLGVCYGVLGDLDKALEEFQTASRLDPSEMMAAYNCGLVHFLQQSYEKALEFFLAAERLGNEVFEAVFQLGRTLLELKRPEEAVDYFEKSLTRKPDSVPAYRYLAEACLAAQKIDAAMNAYRNAVKKNPNDAESLSALGELLDREGKDREIAALFCRQSVIVSPENGLFWERLGRVYLSQKRYEEARKALEQAVSLGRDCLADLEKIPTPAPAETQPQDM